MSSFSFISTMRLYGSVIALVSGVYSIFIATSMPDMSGQAWFMLLLGVIVVAHGLVLLTSAVRYLGRWSGPLMIGYAVLMLLNQGLMTTGGTGSGMGSGMDSGMGSGMDGGMATEMMGADPGMIAIAVLMLASGLIMTVRQDMMSPT